MITSTQTGYAAGGYARNQYPGLSPEQQALCAKDELARRKRLGIAHCENEQDFILSFVDGYQHPISTLPDGLQLYSMKGNPVVTTLPQQTFVYTELDASINVQQEYYDYYAQMYRSFLADAEANKEGIAICLKWMARFSHEIVSVR
jgi:hypothetical protein